MRKKGFTLIELLAILVILAIMVLIALPSLTDTTRKTEEIKNQEVLNSIYMATENYIMANYDSNLDSVGGVSYVSVINDLMGQNYIDINTLNPNNNQSFSSDDVVKVTRNEDWTFSYELTTEQSEPEPNLISTLLQQYGLPTGLERSTTDSNVYYFTGDNDTVAYNYLWYGGHSWRVIEFDTSDNTLLLISTQPLTAISNSLWEIDYSYNSDINSWLNDYFYNSLDSKIQRNILKTTFNVGRFDNIEEITTIQKVGLLDHQQYTRAGGTDSYLDIKDGFWLGNLYDSNYLSYVDANGVIDNGRPSSSRYGVRPVIKISDQLITGGNGSLTSNYEVGSKATSTSDIQVGEYINVPYSGSDGACGSDYLCTFRVVSKDSDNIKVVLNGLLPSTSEYGDTATITTSHTIYTPLNEFANNISNDYRYTGNKTFYIGNFGDYPDSSNYTEIQDETLLASVGLPTVGEMFSGNDIDLGTSSTKYFVDANTIENPTASNNYWLMNRGNSSSVRIVSSTGFLGVRSPTYEYDMGIRPVIFLKSNLTFTGGKGTAELPYQLQ